MKKYSYPEYRVRYYKENKEKLRLYQQEWKTKNPERAKEMWQRSARKYCATPSGHYTSLKQRCTLRGIELNLSREEFLTWYKNQPKKCFYCDIPEEKIKMNGFKRIKRLTVDKIVNEKPYQLGNINLCCYRCNTIKSDFFSSDEMMKIGQEIVKPKWNK